MTEKRFEVIMNEFDEVEYIMDKVAMEDRDFAEFIDFVEDICNENEQLKKQITSLKVELDTHKHPLWSTREAERKVSELTNLLSNEIKKNATLLEEINSLRKENMRLKEVQKYE